MGATEKKKKKKKKKESSSSSSSSSSSDSESGSGSDKNSSDQGSGDEKKKKKGGLLDGAITGKEVKSRKEKKKAEDEKKQYASNSLWCMSFPMHGGYTQQQRRSVPRRVLPRSYRAILTFEMLADATVDPLETFDLVDSLRDRSL